MAITPVEIVAGFSVFSLIELLEKKSGFLGKSKQIFVGFKDIVKNR